MSRLASTLSTITLASSLVGSSYGLTMPRADVDHSDWKYAVGWDGVTLSSDAIGTAVAPPPTSRDDVYLEKRTVGGVYICTDLNWKGTCGYAVQPVNTCIRMGQAWAFDISSFGPDECTTCVAWQNYSCTGNWGWTFQHPGDATGGLNDDLTNGPWNDRILSFKCFNSC